MRKITDAGTYNVLGGRKTIAFNGKSDQFNAKRSANVSRYIDTNQGSGMEDLYAIMEKYNIKGFEFGNWVTQEERAEYVASLAPTLEDLFSVLGSRNIGINRNVGVAFGARGSRGALAHYEPILNMINLTRRKGAGSLAHEYGHALDYNLGSFLDQHKTYAALSGGRSVSATLPDNTGGQLRAYVNQIIDSIRNGKNFARMDQENKEADARGQNPVYSSYWYRRTEIFARFFEQYVCYYLYERQKSSRLLVKQWQYYMIVPVYVAKDDFMKIKPIADKLMKEMAKFLNSTKGQRVRATAYPKPVITKPDPEAKKIVKPKPTAAPKRKAATKEKGVKSLDEQFASIKKQYPDAILLFRCGDFYEAYKEDAKEVCKILCITLTHRGKTEACGFPFHALDTYLPKLVRAGKRVAIVDALEDPKNATGKVKRGVTEIVKPKETGKKKESKAQPKNVEMKLTPRHFWTVWFDGNTVRVRKTIFSDHYHIAGHAKGLSFDQIQCFCHNESGQNYPNKNNDYWLRTHVKKDKECYKAAVKRGEYSTYGDVIKKVEGRDWYFRDINDAERFAKKHLPEGGKYMEYDVSDENWRHMLDIISGRIKIK